MAVGVCLGWLPFAGRSLSPDEAGYLIVGGQWTEGSSLYGDFWVDRPPVLIAIFEAADALGGAVPLRLIGALAAVLTVILSGVLGRIAAPERRSAPLLTAGTAAVCVATPLFGATVVNGELLGLPFVVAGILAYVAAAASRHQVRGFLLSLAAGAAGADRGAGQAEHGRRVRGGGRAAVHQRGGPQEVPGAAGRRAGDDRDRGGRSPGRAAPCPPTSGTPSSPSASTRPVSWPVTAATPRSGWSSWWARWPRAAYRSWSPRSPGRAAARRRARARGRRRTCGWRRTSCSPSSCSSPSSAAATGCTTCWGWCPEPCCSRRRSRSGRRR